MALSTAAGDEIIAQSVVAAQRYWTRAGTATDVTGSLPRLNTPDGDRRPRLENRETRGTRHQFGAKLGDGAFRGPENSQRKSPGMLSCTGSNRQLRQCVVRGYR